MPLISISRSITLLAGAAAVPLTALAAAGCGGGGETTASPTPPRTASGGPATVGVATTGLGKILVDSKGRTIYLFKKDTGTKSTCGGECAIDWPPVRASGNPKVGGGVDASLVGTTVRSDGAPQVTYNGHPLYLYEGDDKGGDTNGQGLRTFGALWWALSAAGSQVTAEPSGSSGGGSSYGGSGGGY